MVLIFSPDSHMPFMVLLALLSSPPPACFIRTLLHLACSGWNRVFPAWTFLVSKILYNLDIPSGRINARIKVHRELTFLACSWHEQGGDHPEAFVNGWFSPDPLWGAGPCENHLLYLCSHGSLWHQWARPSPYSQWWRYPEIRGINVPMH